MRVEIMGIRKIVYTINRIFFNKYFKMSLSYEKLSCKIIGFCFIIDKKT